MDILVHIDCLLDEHHKRVVAGDADGLAQITLDLAEKLASATALLGNRTTSLQRQQLARMREKTVSIAHLVRMRIGNTQRSLSALETAAAFTAGNSSGPLYASAGQIVSRFRRTSGTVLA